jgi:Zn-dependent protease
MEPAPTPSPPTSPLPEHGELGVPVGSQPHHEKSASRERSAFRQKLGAAGAAVLAFLAKFKTILLALPKIKLLATSGTMVVSIAAYASIWGLWFAVGFVVLLLVHEMGHVIELRRQGIKASTPMFIPFVGALITSKSLGGNAAAEARVGLAGPILGSIGASVCLVVYHVTHHDYWRALAFTGFFLNLFNLLPVVPLDGGRAMAAMAPWMWFAGFAAIVALAFIWPNPVMIIILLFAALETWRRWKLRRTNTPDQQAYYQVSPRDRLFIAFVYVGLIAALAVGMDATHLARTL